jgi:hypothetical protein
MPTKEGPYSKSGVMGKPSAQKFPNQVPAYGPGGPGVGPYAKQDVGTPSKQTPPAEVSPSSSSGPGVGPYAK